METHADTTGNGGAHVDVGRHVVVSFNVGAKAWEDALEIGNTAPIDKFPKTPCNETSCGFAPVMVPGFLSTFMHVQRYGVQINFLRITNQKVHAPPTNTLTWPSQSFPQLPRHLSRLQASLIPTGAEIRTVFVSSPTPTASLLFPLPYFVSAPFVFHTTSPFLLRSSLDRAFLWLRSLLRPDYFAI